MDIHKIILPTPYGIGDVNAYLVKGDTLSLIDAGPKTEETYEALRWGLKTAGYEMSDIEQVVLTHHHPDHAGWVDAFPNAALLGHSYVDYWMRKEADFLAYRHDFYVTELKKQGVPDVDIEKIVQVRGEMELFGTTPLTGFLAEGDKVPGHPGLRVYEMLGHAQSHLIFIDEKTQACIGGDLLLQKVSSNPLVEPPQNLTGDRPKSLLQYNESLRRLRTLNPAIIYPGHGEEIHHVSDLVTERLERQQERASKILQLIEQPITVQQLTKQFYGKVYHQQPGLTLSEIVGQVDYLEHIEAVQIEEHEGVHYYKKA